jgi:hypothetical protein
MGVSCLIVGTTRILLVQCYVSCCMHECDECFSCSCMGVLGAPFNIVEQFGASGVEFVCIGSFLVEDV